MSNASFNVPKSKALVVQYYGNRTDAAVSNQDDGPQRLDQYGYYDIYWAQIQYVSCDCI